MQLLGTSLVPVLPGCDEDELDAADILDAYTAQSWSEDGAVADALSRIRGAFALIIHDAAEERVIAARDREVRDARGSGDLQRAEQLLSERACWPSASPAGACTAYRD